MAGRHPPGNLDPVQRRQGRVHGGVVAGDDLGAAPAVGLGDRLLDRRDRLITGHDPGDREEAGLQDGVHPPAQPGVAGHLAGVDGVEGDLLGQDLLLSLPRQRVPHLLGRVRGVEQHGRAGRRAFQHLMPPDHPRLMAADEARLADQVGGLDRGRPEPQVRDRLRPRLLRVVDEVGLGVPRRIGAEDLDAVLVRPHRSIRAQPEEQRPHRLGGLDVQDRVERQAGAGDVVGDADREPRPGPVPAELGEDSGHHARGELL